MKRLFALLVFLSVISISSPMALSAPADRFTGGTCDGYDKNAFIQIGFTALANARFKGASSDGYDKSIVENTDVSVFGGMVIMVR